MSNPYDTAKQKNSSILGPTLKFKGELSAKEDLLIQGQIEGSIKHSSNLTIGEEGKVKANVSAEYIAVEGTVEGDLHGTQSITVRDSAKITGNIVSPTVSLLEGATFNGSIDMSGKAAAAGSDGPRASKPEPAESEDAESDKASRKSVKSGKTSASAA